MKNLLHRPVSRVGLPFHGLVTDGVLSTPGGNLAITHTASVEGAIPFQLRTPIADSRNATQIAADTTNGWDFKDYALLGGWYRAIAEGTDQLGALAWLYADENDVVWVIELVPTFYFSSPNYYYDIAVWRRAPFGRFRFGLDPRNLADELLTTLTLQVVDMDYRDGASVLTRTASQIGLGMGLKASSIVPSLNGDVVHISILNTRTEVLEGTASYWELALRGVWATTTLTLSGSGALDGDGTGIAAAFSGTLKYPDFITKAAAVPGVPATISPSPINHITTYDTSDCPPAPSGPGTCQQSCDAIFTHQGTLFESTSDAEAWDDLPGEPALGDAAAVVYRYHGVSATIDCKQTYYRWQDGDYQNYLEGQVGGLGTAEMSSEQTLTAVEGPPGTWTWDAGPLTQVCSAWQAQESQYRLYNGAGVDINGNTDLIQLQKEDDVGQRAILGVGTPADCGCISWQSDDGYPGAIGNFSNRTYTFTEPYTITDADTDAYCNLDQSCRLIVFPGIVGYVIAHGVPNGIDTSYTQVRHRGKLWGIGSDGTLTLITSWGPVIEVDLTIRFPWTSVAWEPVDKTFNVQTDGVTLVKYV